MGLITFKTFDNSMDAHILKIKLESEGITCFLFDEHIVSVNPLYSNLVGGIKLKINEEDLAHSKNIVFELEQTPYTTEDEKVITCPKCESTHLQSGYKSMRSVGAVLSAIASFLFFIFPYYRKDVYKCLECGNEFDLKKT
jgi:Zn finger protein HypA/HybF involved in hydrogenase expression